MAPTASLGARTQSWFSACLVSERAKALGVARAIDGSFIARHFAFFVHATADPVERRAPPHQRQHNALAERGEHVAATDVGMLVLEQSRPCRATQRDRFRQNDRRLEQAGRHRPRRFRADDNAHALHAGLQRFRQVGRRRARHQALDSDQITRRARQQEQPHPPSHIASSGRPRSGSLISGSVNSAGAGAAFTAWTT
jgi:hypothetical protein